MIGGGGVGIARVPVDPADRLARLDMEADRVEPDMGSSSRAAHDDLHRLQSPCRPEDQEGGRQQRDGEKAAGAAQQSAARLVHCDKPACCSAETCHRMMWAWGTSTPGWPAVEGRPARSTERPGAAGASTLEPGFRSAIGIM